MILILGKHGHVFPGEAPEIHAQEHFQHACTSQSHEQSWAGGRRRGRHRRYVSPLMFYLWISGEKSTSSLTVLIKMSKSDTFIVYYAYLKFEQRTFDFQILMERKKRRMQRMMMKMMKEMKLKRRERKMTGRITWGSERRCRDMKHHLLVFDLFFFIWNQTFRIYIFVKLCQAHCLFNDFLSVSFPFQSWETLFEAWCLTTSRIVFAFSEPVNRKQSNPSLFDTHRSPARRSHIRFVLICEKSKSILMPDMLRCVTLKQLSHYHDSWSRSCGYEKLISLPLIPAD